MSASLLFRFMEFKQKLFEFRHPWESPGGKGD